MQHYFVLTASIFVSASVNAWVLFISTDYVFDGTSPPYTITDKPNPLNLYGKSKVEGEQITLCVSSGINTYHLICL